MKTNFTIITPSLNSGNKIQKCLDSVKSQKGVSVYHIIIDGGSTDNTIEILNANLSNYKILNGSSIYEALNYGYNESNSDLVGFLNCDDFYTSNDSLKKIYNAFKNNDSHDIFYGNCRFVNSKNKLLYNLISPKQHSFFLQKKRLFSISHPCWFIKHEKFKINGKYDTSFKYVSDCDFIIRALKNNMSFFYVNTFVTNFLLHENNASKSGSAKDESIRLLSKYNSNKFISIFFHKALLILLYLKDINYFFYKFRIKN